MKYIIQVIENRNNEDKSSQMSTNNDNWICQNWIQFWKLNAQDALQNLSQLITFDLESNMPNSEILFDSDSILESSFAKLPNQIGMQINTYAFHWTKCMGAGGGWPESIER